MWHFGLSALINFNNSHSHKEWAGLLTHPDRRLVLFLAGSLRVGMEMPAKKTRRPGYLRRAIPVGRVRYAPFCWLTYRRVAGAPKIPVGAALADKQPLAPAA